MRPRPAAVRIEKRQTVSSAAGRSVRYVLVDDADKSFTLYVADGKVADFVAVGFDLGR